LHLRYIRIRGQNRRPSQCKNDRRTCCHRAWPIKGALPHWIGEPDSDLRGQVGLECVKNDCIPWERELREMEEVYDPILLELKPLRVGFSFGQCPDNRRRYERFNVVGAVQIMSGSSPEFIRMLFSRIFPKSDVC